MYIDSIFLLFSALEVLYIKPVNMTAIKLKWAGHPLFPTRVHYQSFFNETGVLMTQHVSLVPINVTSLEINIDDSVPGYVHTISLQFVKLIVDTPITTASFTFGKSIAIVSVVYKYTCKL